MKVDSVNFQVYPKRISKVKYVLFISLQYLEFLLKFIPLDSFRSQNFEAIFGLYSGFEKQLETSECLLRVNG